MEHYELLNGLTLAYIGDSYYELCIRKHVLDKNYTKVQDLHRLTIKYVSAKAQSKIIRRLMDEGFLTETERNIVKRGRNSKTHHKRQNVDKRTYDQSTAFEALIGYLYLLGQFNRLNEVIKQAIAIIENGD